MKRKMTWIKHCKSCGKFAGKNGKHPGGKCESGFKGHPSPLKDLKLSVCSEYFSRIPLEPMTENVYMSSAIKTANLVWNKQYAYGDSFGKSGKIIAILYPDGIKPHQMGDALTIIRIIDKMFRIATAKDAFGEDPWADINGYSLLAMTKRASESPSKINS